MSQIDALMLGNGLDHFIKEQLHIRGYGRYMDDGYLICEDVRYLEECAARIRQYCAGIGLQLSEKKTRILPIRQGVRFLKTKFKLTQTGGVIPEGAAQKHQKDAAEAAEVPAVGR